MDASGAFQSSRVRAFQRSLQATAAWLRGDPLGVGSWGELATRARARGRIDRAGAASLSFAHHRTRSESPRVHYHFPTRRLARPCQSGLGVSQSGPSPSPGLAFSYTAYYANPHNAHVK
ncbi:hypothetical protein VTO73DRAFT_14253 [Trametes versicolor]